MKQSLLTVLCIAIFSLPMTAQITINRADFTVNTTRLDSSSYKLSTKTGAMLPTFGTNQVWDYSALKDSLPNIGKDYYYPVANFGAVPTAFADATGAINYSTVFQVFQYPSRAYLKLDATGYAQLGYITQGGKFPLAAISGGATDSIYFSAATFRFTNPEISYKFPMTANSVWKSDYKDSSNFQLSIAAFGLNKTPGLRVAKYSYTDTIVGWGTLKMKNPAGGAALSYAVLLKREIGTQLDSFFVGGAPAPAQLLGAFGLTQGALSTVSAYFSFLGIGFNEPFMSIYPNSTGGIGNIYRGILPTLGLTVDNKEPINVAVATKVYPNPTTEAINLEFQKTSNSDWHVMLYDAAGKIIFINRVSAAQGNVNQRVTFDSALPSGTYFYNLLDETSLIRANGKVVLNR
jgi:Secretion system C-terminal sorting domain